MLALLWRTIGAAALGGTLWLNSVPTALTVADKDVFAREFAGLSLPTATFDDQVSTIQQVQHVLARIAPELTPIDEDETREPADVEREKRGICYDRSRFIEKALTYLGLETRHVAIYRIPTGGSAWRTLVTHGASHALTEVRTSRGWMLVDSIEDWIGLTADGRVVSADTIARDGTLALGAWDRRVKGHPNLLLEARFVDVVGLYSRHGNFYWPYIPIPDVNWTQMSGWLVGL
jgi:hypothetical protein